MRRELAHDDQIIRRHYPLDGSAYGPDIRDASIWLPSETHIETVFVNIRALLLRKARVARTSKSPRAVVLAALSTAQRALPEYAHRYSPKKFTQHQLFACLVLKQFLRTDYRGLAVHLTDNPSLTATLGLKQVPHFTTFQKASQRLLLTAPVRKLLKSTVRWMIRVVRAACGIRLLAWSC